MTKLVVSQESGQISYSQGHELILALQRAGMKPWSVQRIIQSPENNLARKLVNLAFNNGYEDTSSQRRAREIMGNNFIGIGEVQGYFGLIFSPHQTRILAEIPYSEQTLRETKDSCLLFPGYPFSIVDLQNLLGGESSLREDIYSKLFASDKVFARWYLISKSPWGTSLYEPFEKQLEYIAKYAREYEVPRACEVIYMLLLYSRARKDRLMKGWFTWCRGVEKSERIVVGGDNQSGIIYINPRWIIEKERDFYLGINISHV